MDSECGGHLQALQGVAWVSSPTYNGHVRGNLDCDWIITAQDDSVVNVQVTPLLNMNLYFQYGIFHLDSFCYLGCTKVMVINIWHIESLLYLS